MRAAPLCRVHACVHQYSSYHLSVPKRKYTRLKYFDYRTPGAYFITACAAGRKSAFGHIVDSVLQPSRLGKLVSDQISSITEHHGVHVRIDASVVMPNHMHMILFLGSDPSTYRPILKSGIRLQSDIQAGSGGVLAGSMGAIIGSYKSAITREAKLAGIPSGPVFQAGFYEHVIRHEGALNRIRAYITNNPRQWELDRENPERSGEHAFYAWLEAYAKYLLSADFPRGDIPL